MLVKLRCLRQCRTSHSVARAAAWISIDPALISCEHIDRAAQPAPPGRRPCLCRRGSRRDGCLLVAAVNATHGPDFDILTSSAVPHDICNVVSTPTAPMHVIPRSAAMHRCGRLHGKAGTFNHRQEQAYKLPDCGAAHSLSHRLLIVCTQIHQQMGHIRGRSPSWQ